MSRGRRGSSRRWLAEHENDPYVQEARRRGFRSRAVFKLEEIDRRDHLLRPGLRVVDLGAAPGGWSQYARPRLGPRGVLVATDLLPIEPLAGVEVLIGDFREAEITTRLAAALGGEPADLVMSDMAPNISGIDAADQAASLLLAEYALDFSAQHLREGGDFLVKVFQGSGSDAFVRQVRARFERVHVRKPQASRARSREVYLLARNHRLV
jgi:23S rRNA (uridine2552-2'-O)-methyltransferase